MSSGPNPRRPTKRRGARGPKRGIVDIDLNSPPPAADIIDVASSSGTFQNVHPDIIDVASPSGNFRNVRFRGSLINLDDHDDSEDVQMMAAPRLPPQAPIVVLDEEEEINPHSAGVTRDVINLDLSLDLELLGSKREAFTNPNPNPIMEPVIPPSAPKEPTFNCPVCMNPLVEASSTICGHIFCKECIKMAIKAQKKCPTCRRKLTASNFHRVYLPSAE